MFKLQRCIHGGFATRQLVWDPEFLWGKNSGSHTNLIKILN